MAARLLLLVLPLLALAVFADVNIDCGSSDIYTDGDSIVWMGDNDLIQNGVVQSVPSGNSISHVMDTMRVFTSRKKNCYTINAANSQKVLVRASFYYGNYDQKSSPPTFDLQLDGNDWATVQTSATDLIYYEAVYVVKGNAISICLAQTKPGQFPFMSALQVRSLDSKMYSHVGDNFALFLKSRVAYGTNETIRYSDDIYDRIWRPVSVGSGLVTATSDSLFVTVNLDDNPPQAVLQNAITTPSTSEYIILGTLAATVSPVYINMYFSEVTQLDSTQKRSFRVFKDNQSFSDPILPPYGGVLESSVGNLTLTSNATFSLVPTTDSTLPPLINAMEVFYVSDALTDGTNNNDVEGLGSLQVRFAQLQDWGGDPCLPAPYSWDWINCNSDATPRVTELHLSGFGLSGLLPDFSSMTALEVIDMHNNSIFGAIPDYLGSLPNLKELNLADNQFSGPIPTSISKNNKIKLVVTGNPNVCASGGSCQTVDSTPAGIPVGTSSGGSKKKSNKAPAILGATIPSFFVFWLIVGVLVVMQKRKKAALAAAGAGPTGGAVNRPNANANANANQTPEGSPAYLLGKKFGEVMIDEFRSNIEQQGDGQNNNYNNSNNV